ncbi:MAG: hypothetical protein KAU31_17525 [Spirochaetaceae bacterium]|nr:hypothetical protein [Spirochaetaceae bacterium]
MTGKRVSFLVLLLCLAICLSAVSAQDLSLQKDNGKTIRIVQEGVPSEFDADQWLGGGEFQLAGSLGFTPPRVIPGPAPEPYPNVHVWEKRIEQLGISHAECDGIYFQTGKIWVPNKKIFVVWKIRIPMASMREASEFEQDLNVALWVDWNLSGDWEKNEEVIRASLNIEDYFPNEYSHIDIEFLTYFRVPDASVFATHCGGIEFFKEKLWTRGVLSYCDDDASPNGESVFGEVEDYQVCYFEVVHTKDKLSK